MISWFQLSLKGKNYTADFKFADKQKIQIKHWSRYPHTRSGIDLDIYDTRSSVDLDINNTRSSVDLDIHNTRSSIDLDIHYTRSSIDLDIHNSRVPSCYKFIYRKKYDYKQCSQKMGEFLSSLSSLN